MTISTIRKLPSPETKIGRVLMAFLLGRSLNLIEAQQQCGERCLHNTVSILQRRYGVTIDRKFETIPGYEGKPTQCCRYWIEPEELKRIIYWENTGLQKEKAHSVETRGPFNEHK
jgi:hypothetical protein